MTQTKLAEAVSVLFHPAWVPLWVTWVVFYYCPFMVLVYLQAKYYVFLLILLFSVVAPLGSSFLLYKAGYLQSMKMPNRADRPLPLAIATLYQSMLAYFIITKMQGAAIIGVAMLSVSVALTLLTFLSTYQKISIHTAGFSGAIGFLFALYMFYPDYALIYPLMFAVVCCGAVMTARLVLRAHRVEEVWSGFAVGFLCCFGTTLLFLVFWL